MSIQDEHRAEVYEVLENIITDVFLDCPEGIAVNMLASNCTRALDAAGILAPDLPAPGAVDEFGNASWFAGPEAGHGYVYIGEYEVLSPDEARYLARQILAAAKYAEEEK